MFDFIEPIAVWARRKPVVLIVGELRRRTVRSGDVALGHARVLLPLEECEQLEVAQRILDENWNVRQSETFVQDMLTNDTGENE